jgi:hypothetical protein
MIKKLFYVTYICFIFLKGDFYKTDGLIQHAKNIDHTTLSATQILSLLVDLLDF